MKKIFIYIVLICGAAISPGCERYLEEAPQNKLSPATTDDYDQLLNRGYITEQIMPYLDALGDDIELIASNMIEGANYANSILGAYMWEDSHEVSLGGGDPAFAKLYESIFYANVVIDDVEDAIGVELNDAKVEATRLNIKGEALVLRAYSYFYLVNLYAPYYNPETAEEDAGIPINLSTAAEDKAYRRNSVAEVYSQIVSDLTEGIRLMEENPIEKAAKIKFDPLSAKAVLARVYLYMQEWDEAIRYATEVVNENHNIFNLHQAGEILTMENNLSDSWNDTVIWGTDYLSKDNINIIFVNGANELIPVFSFWPYVTAFSANTELGEQFEENDVRRLYFMFTYRRAFSADLVLEKLTCVKNRYMDLNSYMNVSPSSGYSRVIRIEEMLLIIAEANAKKTNPDIRAAVDALNTLREPKFRQGYYTPLDPNDFNAQSLIDYVALERRRELCFEGHRWFDLRRTTRPAMQRVGYEDEIAILNQNDPRYVLQIPMREISINPEIGINPR